MDDAARSAKGAIDPRLLELLSCPLTKGPLRWDEENGELISTVGRIAYPVRDGIPIMLVAEARQLDEGGVGRLPPK